MGDHTGKVVVNAGKSGIVVETEAKHWPAATRLLLVATCTLLAVALGGTTTVWYLHHKHAHDALVAQQQQLQKSVTGADRIGNITKLKADSDSLIQGAADGTYKLTNVQLAQAYNSRADTELSGGNYKEALADYQKAVQLDASLTITVGYGEFLARYHLGERETLVPLLQTLEKPLQNDHEMQSQQQLALYQSYETDLRAGRDLAIQ
jgi:tetratricopeptide (TPR) repeat protein